MYCVHICTYMLCVGLVGSLSTAIGHVVAVNLVFAHGEIQKEVIHGNIHLFCITDSNISVKENALYNPFQTSVIICSLSLLLFRQAVAESHCFDGWKLLTSYLPVFTANFSSFVLLPQCFNYVYTRLYISY